MSGRVPVRALRVGRVPAVLLDRGVPLGSLRLLETRGRRSGELRSVPVAMVRFDGRRWLVAPFGDTHWVHNARAHPRATLRRGTRRETVRLVEVDDEPRSAVLRTYRRRFAAVPFVRDAFDAAASDPPELFAAEAHRHPVFLVRPER